MENNILFGITTYGSAPYVDLSLYFLKQQYHYDVIVLDDGSQSVDLLNVCKKYDVQLFNLNVQRQTRKTVADVRNTFNLIKIGYLMNKQFVIKQSRRWICMEDPVENLLKLNEQSDGCTYSNFTHTFNFGFRTQFMALRVKQWIKIINRCDMLLNGNNEVFAQGQIHNFAKSIQPTSQKYLNYINKQNYSDDSKGYIHWGWMGNDRVNVPPYVLWHDSHNPRQYYNKSKQVGLTGWTLNDFERVNG